MRRMFALLLLCLAGTAFMAGCQVTFQDLTPFEYRRSGGGESPEQPKPEPPKPENLKGKDVIYSIGLKGID